jgi:hypothetical protein
VVELDAPALVRGVLRDDLAAHEVADGGLLSGIGPDLAAEHADGIGALGERPIVPALDRGEAEADGLGRRRVLPRACGQLLHRGTQLALVGRRCQQLSNDREAQMRPPLVHSRRLAHDRHSCDGAPR